MQRQCHGQGHFVRRCCRCLGSDRYRRVALHQNSDPGRTGWLYLQSIDHRHEREGFTYFAL